uniref:G/T mismatch-specific thymine DNA glycosylase n=1 Tax=Fundulus heteroclitus TaxID=8078 RepID=A0A3Q2TLA5_FUNHE
MELRANDFLSDRIDAPIHDYVDVCSKQGRIDAVPSKNLSKGLCGVHLQSIPLGQYFVEPPLTAITAGSLFGCLSTETRPISGFCSVFFFLFFLLSVPAVTPVKKKRGRPSKQQAEAREIKEEVDEAEAAKKAKRVLNRFNGMSVAEVMTKTLPDVLTYNLDILIIGINPGLLSAFKGHHYPNPGNHFWKCLFLSGLTEQQLNYMHDQSLPEKYSIGFTNMVERTTPGSKDLSSKEIREGGRQLLEKLQKYRPLIAAFNGKGIYETFSKEIFGVKGKALEFGLQPYKIPETETVCFLMPSSSPRCAQFPRAQDKVHFYIKLKELRDRMKGLMPNGEVLETQYSFDLQLAKEDAKRIAIKEEQVDPEYESCSGLHDGARQSS